MNYVDRFASIYTLTEMVAVVLEYDKHKNDGEFKKKFITPADFLRGHLGKYDLDYKQAESVIEEVAQRLMMSVLKDGKLSPYQTSLADLVNNPTTPLSESKIGIVYCIPKILSDFSTKDEINTFATGSNYIGAPGEKIELWLRILSCRRVEWENGFFYACVAVDKVGNLYSLSPKTPLMPTDNFAYHIRAKIKKHEINRYVNNAKVTYLNYVKAI